MLSSLSNFLAAMLVTAFSLVAQQWPPPELQVPMKGSAYERLAGVSPVVATVLHVDVMAFETLHEDGLVSLMGVADDGSLCQSFATASDLKTFVPQGPLTSDPVPVLTTTWCDEKGVTHTVTTPIVGSGEAGITKAAALHEKLVTLMQAKHPPKPCPPPNPAPGGKVSKVHRREPMLLTV